ncbi:MAG: hypothetical protein ACPGU1_23130 [Myxococcota bacterium]
MRAILSTLVITLIAVAAPACGSSETSLGGGDDQGADSFGGADGATLADGQGSGGASDATTADVAPPTPDAPSQPDPGPQDTAAPPAEDVSDAAVPPSPDPDAGFGPEDVAEPEPEGDAAIEGCEEGQVVNCEGGCTPAFSLGDAWCDPVFDCEALDFDNGDCVQPPHFDNHPCEVGVLPFSSDPDITACVCAQDAWCCTNAWDSLCVQLADGVCGASCDCSEDNCEADADCGACFGNACVDGEWTCDEGMCVQGEPVVCDDPEAVGCLTAQCDPETGACVTAADPELCDDSSACTIDSCDGETGACTYASSDVCGDQHPCASAISPGNGDPDVQACVCDLDPYCCNSAWDAACIDEAQANCGLVCNCLEASEEALACETNADCAWCGESACTGIFICEEGTCQC